MPAPPEEPKTVLAGKMMAVVELLTHRPIKVSYNANRNGVQIQIYAT
jgi:hypothetical protein